MAGQRYPYLVAGDWTLDVDPNDKVFYVADVTEWLTDNATTATSFDLVTDGVTVLEKGAPQGDRGGLLPVKLEMTAGEFATRLCTFRTTTADGQQFDKTMKFKLVQN